MQEYGYLYLIKASRNAGTSIIMMAASYVVEATGSPHTSKVMQNFYRKRRLTSVVMYVLTLVGEIGGQ